MYFKSKAIFGRLVECISKVREFWGVSEIYLDIRQFWEVIEMYLRNKIFLKPHIVHVVILTVED